MSPIRTAPTIRCRSSPRVIAALEALHLDDGNDSFQPSNLEITAVETASKATNVIPGWARAQLNIRFNNLQRGEDLVALVRRTAEAAAPGATVEAKISGEAFLTPPGPIYEIVSAAIHAETGAPPAALHPWRHLGRPLPDRALPGGRFRPAQRDHAQARRGGGGGRHPRPARIYARDRAAPDVIPAQAGISTSAASPETRPSPG